MVGPLIVLAGLGAVLFARSSSTSGKASPGTPQTTGSVGLMSCDAALQVIKGTAPDLYTPIASAIASGTNIPGLQGLAASLEKGAATSQEPARSALLTLAACLRMRADMVGKMPPAGS